MKGLSGFTEESRLIIKNWNSFEALIQAGKNLGAEIDSLLSALEVEFKAQPWWSKNWLFKRNGSGQIYVTRKEWVRGKEDLVWIGTENFLPKNLFGDALPPSTYVWVSKPEDHRGLISNLKATLGALPGRPGDLVTTDNGGYILQKNLPKLQHEQLDQLDEIVLRPVAAWIEFYAGQADLFDDAIRRSTGARE